MRADGLPRRHPLARIPTPIERLPAFSQRLGVELYVKRDDLTGFLTSGNKVRKLEFFLAEALRLGSDTLVTCGALQSNHARATAVVARRLGMESVLVLRGEEPEDYGGNLLVDRMVGARIKTISPEEWPERDLLMVQAAEELRSEGRRPYIIPEGGSNALGACGYLHWVAEVKAQCHETGLEFDSVVHAVGSGGTSAGLLMGRAVHGFEPALVGFPVCDDAESFRARIGAILNEASNLFGWARGLTIEGLELIDGYVGGGYGVTRPEEWDAYMELARSDGMLLDPVYTGKAFFGMMKELPSRRELFGRRVLFVHTGGLFALFAREPEIRERLRP